MFQIWLGSAASRRLSCFFDLVRLVVQQFVVVFHYTVPCVFLALDPELIVTVADHGILRVEYVQKSIAEY